MTTLQSYGTTVVLDQCWCGIWFGMPDGLHLQFREEGQKVYCPLGHTCVVRKTDAQKLREEKRRLEARLVAERDQHQATQRSLVAQKGVTTRIKNRVKNGVCPFCNRHFQNVKAHMDSQHAEAESG